MEWRSDTFYNNILLYIYVVGCLVLAPTTTSPGQTSGPVAKKKTKNNTSKNEINSHTTYIVNMDALCVHSEVLLLKWAFSVFF